MSRSLLTVDVSREQDVVAARQRARQLAGLLGFDVQDQTRIATAVSEVARNAVQHAGRGRVELRLEDGAASPALVVEVTDRGPGIPDLHQVLSGSPGLGILSARRLMDEVAVDSGTGRGTTVRLQKALPPGAAAVDGPRRAAIAAALARDAPPDALDEVRQQSRELLRTLDDLEQRQEELQRLNRELEDTNRGVVALYAELDEKAEHLRRADEMKTRFLSNMSHEFRTPLNSILAISRLLIDRTDGDLTPEQERQVGFIRKAAQDLAELVDDLLDLAKVEAGRIDVRPAEFEAGALFGALRGMLRPLQAHEAVSLVFENPDGVPPLYTDEGKVAQILRNFISNALKFTERGEVRVAARAEAGGERIVFSVADTGIGIAPADQERIFQEFGQVESRLQGRYKGTGLGLALSRRLAELLGGGISLVSAPGVGSTFSLAIPCVHPAVAREAHEAAGRRSAAGRALIIDDEEAARYVLRALLAEIPVEAVESPDGAAGLERVRAERPAAIFLDLVMPGLTGFDVLAELDADPATRQIPVVVTTSKRLAADERELLARRAVPVLSKETWNRSGAVSAIRDALARAGWSPPEAP